MAASPSNRHAGEPRQEAGALELNAVFFADNASYKRAQNQLELYRFIALVAAHETEHARALLDIGNGGFFAYPIEHIPRVVAIDVFIEADFATRYPHAEWRQMSALEMAFDEQFDTVIAINTLHHVIGSTVDVTYSNLGEILTRTKACLQPEGKLVLVESTMPRWFVRLYSLAFPVLVKWWPFSHPPTFQFHFRDIIDAAGAAGFELRELTFIPKTSDFMFLGRQVKSWMAPIRVAKFVFSVPR